MANDTKKASADAPPGFWAVLMPVLSFVGTGIGLLGFVIFFGGFILWTRFDAIGLPADEAVWHVPREDLVTTGASFLVPTVALGAATAALGLVIRDMTIGRRRRSRVRAASRAVTDAELGLERAQARARAALRAAEALKSSAEATAASQGAAALDTSRGDDDRSAALAAHDRARDGLERRQTAASDAEQEAVTAKERLRDARRDWESKHELTPRETKAQYLVGVITMVAICMLYVWLSRGELRFPLVLGVIAMATFVVALASTVLSATRSYGWFALSAFVGVGLVVAVTTYFRTQNEVKVVPAAVIADGAPVVGYLVAETGDAVYLAQPSTAAGVTPPDSANGRTRLVRFDKKQISDLAVSDLASRRTAYARALSAAAELCAQLRPAKSDLSNQKTPNKKAAGKKVVATPTAETCSADDRGALAKRLNTLDPKRQSS